MQIARCLVNMVPDNEQAGEGAHAIEYCDRILLWKIF